MAVKHTKVATVADDGTSEVGTNEWNDDHTIDNGTINNDHLTGSIANTKLATDPLARANHTGSQAQSTVTSLTSDLALKSPLASPTFTGTVTTAAVDVAGNNIDNIQNLIHDTSSTTTALDFSGDQLQTISISANTTFTTSNRATGKSKTIKITTDGSTRTLTFPAWKFVGAKPSDQAGSKIGILTLTAFGTADTDIVAAYAVEE